MRPDLPWNVAGIPPEAREAARAAARRDGLSVGEWLTRRILRSFSDGNGPDLSDLLSDTPAPRADERPTTRRDTEEMLAHVSRSETDTSNAYKRLEDQIRTFARRVDATERNQSEHTRAMSKAAAEINVATREHAQAFDQLGTNLSGLNERIDRVERHAAANDGMRDAVKGLHQGLTRLADQISNTANNSATQISALADNLESVANKVGEARLDTESMSRLFETRNLQTEDRIRAVERQLENNANDLARASANSSSLLRLQEGLAKLEARGTDPVLDRRLASLEDSLSKLEARTLDPVLDRRLAGLEENMSRLDSRPIDPALDRRLNGIERTLADLAARAETPDRSAAASDERIKALAVRLDAAEKAQRDAIAELRKSATAAAAPSAEPFGGNNGFATNNAFAPLNGNGAGVPPQTFDAPPFPDVGAFPPNAPRAADSYLPPFADQPSHDPFPPVSAFGGETLPPPPAPESFLSAARRSAQAAAAQVEAERVNRGVGGFAWNNQQQAHAESPRSRYTLVGLIVLAVVLLAVAGILFSQRLPLPGTHSAVSSSLFGDKASAPVDLKPSSPTSEPTPPTSDVSPAPSTDAPASLPPPRTAQAEQHTAPSSPTLPPLKQQRILPSAVHRVPDARPEPQQTTQARAAEPAPQQTATIPALDRISALANAGNAKAETVVGLRYLDGTGIPVNEAEAAKWLQRAAEHGQPVAEYRLGTMYERGRGVPTDGAKAIHWYQAAAQAGNRKAMHNLAVAYSQGAGVPKDFAEAARWFSKAASLGLADSQFNLAVLYERGLGVPQSLLDAYKWYAIAAAQGDTESKSRIDAIATQLSADDRAAAQRSADQFRPMPLDGASNVPPQLGDLAG